LQGAERLNKKDKIIDELLIDMTLAVIVGMMALMAYLSLQI
jgi:hypothetical protein